jgi:hypothetical protein
LDQRCEEANLSVIKRNRLWKTASLTLFILEDEEELLNCPVEVNKLLFAIHLVLYKIDFLLKSGKNDLHT